MRLTDLTQDSDATLEALHVYAVLAAPERFAGYIGNNLFEARRAEGFTDTVSAGDVLQVSLSETGVYEASEKLGTRPNPSTEHTTYGLPWDYQQTGWDGGTTFYSAAYPLPAALVLDELGRNGVAHYGTVGGSDRYSVAYWGHSCRWSYPGVGVEPAQKLSLIVTEPGPLDLELVLMSAHYPHEAHLPVDVPLTPAVDYFGPSTPNVVTLPPNWVDALADGSAGSIRLAPAGSALGLTTVAVGVHRSLSLHT